MSQGGEVNASSWVFLCAFYALLYIFFAVCIVSWPLAKAYRYLRDRQKDQFDAVRGLLMVMIIVPFLSFWGVVLIDHYQMLIRYAPTDRHTLILFPRLPAASRKMQKNISRLLWDEIDCRRPYRLLWLLMCNPFPQAGFIYFAFFNRGNRFEDQLERYTNKVPRNIDMEKIYTRATKESKKRGYGFTFLGYDFKHREPALLTDEERLRHVQILGGTGSGKTSSLILPMIRQDMGRGRGIVFVDAKGDITTARTMYQMAVEEGRERDFLMFSMSNPEKSNTYNPLALGNATQLKDKIIGAMDFTEPHYKRECESGMQILFDELLKSRGKITLSDVHESLIKPPAECPRFSAFLDDHKKNITGIRAEVSLLMNTEFSHLFNGGEINLLEAYDKKKIVYFALNVLTYGESGKRMGRIITGDLNTLNGLKQNSDSREGFGVYIDEYGAFGTEAFALTLSQGRSAKFMVTIAHQSNADLCAISPHHDGQIKTNTKTHIVLQANQDDAEEFCNEIGTYRTIETTRQVALSGTLEGAEMGSEKVVDVYHINPQELRHLNIGYAAYRTPSRHGLVQLRYGGYADEFLKKIVFSQRERPREIPASMPEIKNVRRERESGTIFDIYTYGKTTLNYYRIIRIPEFQEGNYL